MSVREAPLLQVTGLNHRTADVALRESFSLLESHQDIVLREALDIDGVNEAVVLSTCNRVEFVVSGEPHSSPDIVRRGLSSVLARHAGTRPDLFAKKLYHLGERSAVSHVFRVASGLDSLIVGEPQVLGQLKQAYDRASSSGAAGGVLHRLFHRAFSVAKTVRTRTTITQNAVSVCYAARVLAEQIFGDLTGAKVMLIGAGEMGALSVRHFMSAGADDFIVLNKTLTRACELAEVCRGVAGTLDQLSQHLLHADIVIGAATLENDAPPLVDSDQVVSALRKRDGRPQFYIDLAVPRNFAGEIDSVSDAYLYNIDDLKHVVDENMNARRVEAERAETIVEAEVERFWRWFESRHIEESIRELAETYGSFRSEEVNKTMRRLQRLGVGGELSDQFRLALDDLSQALLAKALHRPITALKQRSEDPAALQMFRELFLPKKSEESDS